MTRIPKNGKTQHRATGIGGLFLTSGAPTDEIHYGRNSTEDQAEAGTILNQQHALGLQARDRGARVVGGFWDEGISGTVELADRPEGRKLLECARAHPGAVVVVYKLDRLGRSLRAILDAYDALDAIGVEVRSMTEPVDTKTPFGRFMFQFLASMAELERGNILERTADGRGRCVRDGRWPGGVLPLGYDVDEGGHLIPSRHPVAKLGLTEAELAIEMFRRVAAGGSALGLANWLNGLGVPAERRYAGGKTVRVSAGYWRGSRVAPMLRSTTYIGRHVVEMADGPVERAVPALVDGATFADAQRVLSSNQRTARRNRRRDYLLSGLMVCADPACGCSYVGVTSRRTTRNGPQEYPSYACAAARNKATHPGKNCRAGYLNGRDAEDFIWARCAAYLRDPGRYLGLAQAKLRALMADTTGAEAARKRLYAARQEKDAERERVMMLFTRGHRTYDETERELARVKDEAAAVQRELDALRDKDQLAAAYEEQLTRASTLLASLAARLDDIETADDRAAKRELIETLLVRAEIAPDGPLTQRIRPLFVFAEDRGARVMLDDTLGRAEHYCKLADLGDALGAFVRRLNRVAAVPDGSPAPAGAAAAG